MDLANMKFLVTKRHQKNMALTWIFDVVPIFLFLVDLQVFFALVERKTWAVCLFMDDLLCMKTVQRKGGNNATKPRLFTR